MASQERTQRGDREHNYTAWPHNKRSGGPDLVRPRLSKQSTHFDADFGLTMWERNQATYSYTALQNKPESILLPGINELRVRGKCLINDVWQYLGWCVTRLL